MISISKAAEIYLQKLKTKPENHNKELRLHALDPDTAYAQAGLAFVTIGPEHADDIVLGFEGFQLFIEGKYKDYLYEASIDIKMQDLQTEILIETPHLKPVNWLTEEATLFDKVHFVLETEINPVLAGHGGMAHVIKVSEDNTVFIQFSGGCQGCSQIDVTLQQGLQAVLLEKLPEIKELVDVTNHQAGQMPYF